MGIENDGQPIDFHKENALSTCSYGMDKVKTLTEDLKVMGIENHGQPKDFQKEECFKQNKI